MKKISRLGLGCWGLGGDAYGPIFLPASEIVNKAIEVGYNYFDTAPTYGQGKSELVIGEQTSQYIPINLLQQNLGSCLM